MDQSSVGRDSLDGRRQQAIAELRRRAAAAERLHREFHAAADTPYKRLVTRQGITVWRPRRIVTLEQWRAAIAAAYPAGFWSTVGCRMEALARGEPAAVELAVLFLEADGWFFRSDYLKAKLLRRLARLPLDPDIADRLRSVALAAVDGRDRREFRRYCRLARKLDAPSLRAALADRRTSADPGTRRRAEWMLAAVEQRPVSSDVLAAHTAWYRAARARAEEQRRQPPPGT